MPSLEQIRKRTWQVLEVGDESDQLSRTIDALILTLVFGNVLAVVLESVESIGLVYHELFVGFERMSVAAFSAEFIARIWSVVDADGYGNLRSRRRWRYLFSPMAIVDILAIAPFYLSTFFFRKRIRLAQSHHHENEQEGHMEYDGSYESFSSVLIL